MKEIINLIKEKNVVAFCGAGVSSESGIPTFRGKGGLWEKYDPQIYATREGLASLFLYEVHKMKSFIIDFYTTFLKTKPNYSHFALKELEEKGYLVGIITQNIDDFHYQVGSRQVAEVHGNAYKFICPNCQTEEKRTKKEIENFIECLKKENTKKGIQKEILKFLGKCPKCKKKKANRCSFVWRPFA
jgi:NAD-dependent deacetylase